MLKKTITYTDYEGVTRTETFYFNLNKTELLDLEVGATGGFEKMVQRIVDETDNHKLVELFKEIILKAYGEKSADGKRFVKSEELSKGFSQTEAYVELFMAVATDAKVATDFINGLLPVESQIASAPVVPTV